MQTPEMTNSNKTVWYIKGFDINLLGLKNGWGHSKFMDKDEWESKF